LGYGDRRNGGAVADLRSYQQQLEANLRRGNATEHTHRPALKTLIEGMFPGTVATNEPRREKFGAPDYIITQGETPLGYIEAKDIGTNLNQVERSEQLKRYRESLGNLILTDYLEFRWFVGSEHRLTAKLAQRDGDGRLRQEPGGPEAVEMLLKGFTQVSAPTIKSPQALAERMAKLAQGIRYSILQALKAEDPTDDEPNPLHDQLKAFREILIIDLTHEQFADMYAQTIVYGLFAARCSPKATEPFSRYKAAFELPRTNPFLQSMFSYLAGPNLHSALVWIVEDLVNLLARADIAAILKDFGRRTRQEDPVVHFYETFLAAYDPRLRESRGVYYTPEPVVSYIVRSVDHILKTDFGLRDGLADTSKVKVIDPAPDDARKKKKEVHKVQILDPATGTGTFLYGVIDRIHETVVGATGGNRGMWSGYVSQHLLPRLYGFELLMAPYTVAHMKLGLQLDELGYEFDSNERLRIYLTNALEEAHEFPSLPLFGQELARETQAAGQVKQDAPVMVVLGNPPYSGHSANTGKWIAKLLRGEDTKTGQKSGNYFEVDGKPLGERNPKWLNDDYVKFIRFAQWRIEQTGYGILAFVSNHGYLDNPTFRGMRQSLVQTFDDIYVLDMHGNSKKKETAPDGSKDENVFDIQQGVAIGIFVKRPNGKAKPTVRHAHLWGVREVFEGTGEDRQLTGGKYHWLWLNDVSTTEWAELEPQLPFYLLVPQGTELLPEYNQGWSVPSIFAIYASTVTTARNHFAMAFSPETLVERIKDLRDVSQDDDMLRAKYKLKDVSYWKLATARKQLLQIKEIESYIHPYCYRPFDFRFVYYHHAVCERLRSEIMSHMHKGNVALLTHRPQSPGDFTFVYCTNMIGDQCVAANKTVGGGNSFQFPLYLFPDPSKVDYEPTTAPGGRRPNLAPAFTDELSEKIGLNFVQDGKGDLEATFGPEDVFHYIYAIFHASSYRARYAEFLKIDFPRVPLTANLELFRSLCGLGERLVGLHLMEERGPRLASYPASGDNLVERVRYKEPDDDRSGRVYINATQYFDNVPPEVWSFYIGGYQVCQKWLKDRKGRVLDYDDLEHYMGIASALSETIGLMARIDEALEEHGGWPLPY
jgi:hypothetical protein